MNRSVTFSPIGIDNLAPPSSSPEISIILSFFGYSVYEMQHTQPAVSAGAIYINVYYIKSQWLLSACTTFSLGRIILPFTKANLSEVSRSIGLRSFFFLAAHGVVSGEGSRMLPRHFTAVAATLRDNRIPAANAE